MPDFCKSLGHINPIDNKTSDLNYISKIMMVESKRNNQGNGIKQGVEKSRSKGLGDHTLQLIPPNDIYDNK